MDALFLLRGVAALIFVLSLIGGLAWMAKRFGLLQQTRPGRQLQVVETCTLDARHRIVLFRCGERHQLALIGPNSCQFLNDEIQVSDLPAPEVQPVASNIKDKIAGNIIGWPASLKALS